jgi:hypothetical protein
MRKKQKRITLVCQNPRRKKQFKARLDYQRGTWTKYCSLACRFWQTNEDRFWAQVDKNGPIHPVLQTACWVWTAGSSRSYNGYGRMRLRSENGSYRDAVSIAAHRYSWLLHFGEIPAAPNHYGTMVVMHRCDNPPCVNPDHLKLGTQLENVKDMVKKNRSPDRRGERSSSARLTWSDVRDIRELHAQGKCDVKELAAKYQVNRRTIGRVISHETWIAE